MSDPKQNPVQSLSALMSASMQVTAKLAKTVAEAATGETQENKIGETSLQEFIRHGSTATGSVLALAISAARQGMDGRSNNKKQQSSHSETASPLPSVLAGQILRIPLSIDNPSADETLNLVPALVSLTTLDISDKNKPKITFEPDTLIVAPHDFEKLVVIVKTNKNTDMATWNCVFNLGDAQLGETEFKFNVVPNKN